MSPPRSKRRSTTPRTKRDIKNVDGADVRDSIRVSGDRAFGIRTIEMGEIVIEEVPDPYNFTAEEVQAAFAQPLKDDYEFTVEEVEAAFAQAAQDDFVFTEEELYPTVGSASVVTSASDLITDALKEQIAKKDYQDDADLIALIRGAETSEYDFTDRNDGVIDLYSATGAVEYSKYLRVLFTNVNSGEAPIPIAESYLERVSLCEIIEERKRRPRARVVFDFNSSRLDDNGKTIYTIDDLIDQIPLDTKIYLDMGYVNQYVRFGEFEVIQHDIEIKDGGVSVTVLLESFARMRHTTGYRVFTSGTLLDVLKELYARNGIYVNEESFRSAISQIDLNPILKEVIKINPDDPFVQVGGSDADIARVLSEYLGLTTTIVGDEVRFLPLFSPGFRGDYVLLKHGSLGANVKSISFKAKKPRVNFIREVYRQASLNAQVPNKGKKRMFGSNPKPTPLVTAKPVARTAKPLPPRPVLEVATQSFQKAGVEQRNKAAIEEYNRQVAEIQRENNQLTISDQDGNEVTIDTTGATTEAESRGVPTTTSTKAPQRALGRVLGKIRRQGRILSGTADLLAGSVVVTLAQPLRVSVGSKIYDSELYQIDRITHVIDDDGFRTSLGFTRAMPRAIQSKTSGKGTTTTTQTKTVTVGDITVTPADALQQLQQVVDSRYASPPARPTLKQGFGFQKGAITRENNANIAQYNIEVQLYNDYWKGKGDPRRAEQMELEK